MIRSFLCGTLLAMAATTAQAQESSAPPSPGRIKQLPAYDYGVLLGLMERCTVRAPMLAAQLRTAMAGWEAHHPAERIADLRAGAEAKAVAEGRARAAKMESSAKDVEAGGVTMPIFPFVCAAFVTEYTPIVLPRVSGSRVGRKFSDTAVEIAAPLALAKLDCDSFEGIDIRHPENAEPTVGGIAETWTFRGCGRSLDLNFRWTDAEGSIHMRDDIAALFMSMMP
jgi:hypothetical protein